MTDILMEHGVAEVTAHLLLFPLVPRCGFSPLAHLKVDGDPVSQEIRFGVLLGKSKMTV